MHRNLRYFFAVVLAAAAIDGAASAHSTPTKALATPTKAPVVRIDTGQVRGVEANGVISFKGIPYAAPPVGKLRWRAPQPAQHWERRARCDEIRPGMHADDGRSAEIESCLTLNVLRPATSAKALPVMVWIYGGANVRGQTSLDPQGDAWASLASSSSA